MLNVRGQDLPLILDGISDVLRASMPERSGRGVVFAVEVPGGYALDASAAGVLVMAGGPMLGFIVGPRMARFTSGHDDNV